MMHSSYQEWTMQVLQLKLKLKKKLRKDGISRYDLGREKFLEVAWKWKEDYAKLIRDQWEMIGLT